MKIHHLRNATLIIETDDNTILVDPMLGPKGSIPPFTLFRHKPRKNPTVPLPKNCGDILQKVTHCVITHQHPDHLDETGIKFLKENKIPILCSIKDEKALRKEGLNIKATLSYWETTQFAGADIMGTPATHGYGFVTNLMGNVMGFYLEFAGEPSVYLSSDTIFTKDVHRVLTKQKPDISVMVCGTAQLDIFKPLLMHMDDMLSFVRNAPGKVIANHLEAVNHCPTTRKQLSNTLKDKGLRDKVWIPKDGEEMDFSETTILH